MFPHPGSGAYEIGPEGGPRAVLFHGLTGAPSELHPLACALATAGWRVRGPQLPGHGADAGHLVSTSADQVLEAARTVLRETKPQLVGGLSMGALAAVVAAADETPSVPLVLLAPAIQLNGTQRLFQAFGRLPASRLGVIKLQKGPQYQPPAAVPEIVTDPALQEAIRAAETAPLRPGEDGRASTIPLRWARELRTMQSAAKAAAPRCTGPALLVHGLLDRTADTSGTIALAAALGSASVTIRILPNSPHLLAMGPERGTLAGLVVAFAGGG